MNHDENNSGASTSALLAAAMADLERGLDGRERLDAVPAVDARTPSSATTVPYGAVGGDVVQAVTAALEAIAATTLPYSARGRSSEDSDGEIPVVVELDEAVPTTTVASGSAPGPAPEAIGEMPAVATAPLPGAIVEPAMPAPILSSTPTAPLTLTPMPHGARPRRTPTGTTPPPIPVAALRAATRTTVTSDPTGRIHEIGSRDGSVDVDLEDQDGGVVQALASADRQLASVAQRDIDALFAAEPGRELVDLVDRSSFALDASESVEHTSPLFRLINDLDLDPQPS